MYVIYLRVIIEKKLQISNKDEKPFKYSLRNTYLLNDCR